MCPGVYNVYTGMYMCVQVCTGIYRYVQVCPGVYNVYTGMYMCVQVCTGV